MAGNERNEKDISKGQSSAADTSSPLVSGQEINKSSNLGTACVTNGTRVIRKMIAVDPIKLRQFGLDLKIKRAVSQSIVHSSSLQELNKSSPIKDESRVSRKMIASDPDKLRQIGLDFKVKNSIPQTIEASVNNNCSPAHRTVKLVQKVKLTPALSSRAAKKIPETSINLNMLQQQISNKLKMNNSFPSSVLNHNNKSTIKPIPITDISKIIPKENNYGDRAIHDTDRAIHDTDLNNFRGWSDTKNDLIANPICISISNTNMGSTSSEATAKRLSDTIEPKSISRPKQNNHQTLEALTVKNGTIIKSHVLNASEHTSHRLAPKQVEVTKVVKKTGDTKNQCTFQGTILDNTSPPAITYDIHSIRTTDTASTDNESLRPKRVAHTPKTSVKLNDSVYVKPKNQPGSSIEFTKVPSKSLGGRKTQKIWSRFNKFKKKNKMLQMENQELKNRLYSLMENMNSINSTSPFTVLPHPNASLPDKTSCLVQPTLTSQDLTTPQIQSMPKPCAIFENNIPTSINKEILPIRNEVVSKPQAQINTPISAITTPIESKIDRTRNKTTISDVMLNNHKITKFFSQETKFEFKQSNLDINRNKLVSFIKEKENLQAIVPAIIHEDGNEMPVPEIARELEIRDQNFYQHHDEIDIIMSKAKLLGQPDELNHDEDLHEEKNLEMNISVDSTSEHDYSFREKQNAPFEKYEPKSLDLTFEDSPASIKFQHLKTSKSRPNIVVLENRLLLPNEKPEAVQIYSNLGSSKLRINNENFPLKSGGKPHIPNDVPTSGRTSRTSSRNSSLAEEPSHEILTIDTSDSEDFFIEPPAYSPIEQIIKPITVINDSPLSIGVEASNVPPTTLENVTTTNPNTRTEEFQLKEIEILEYTSPVRKTRATTSIIGQNKPRKPIPSLVANIGAVHNKASDLESSPPTHVEPELLPMNNLDLSSLKIVEKLTPNRKSDLEKQTFGAFPPIVVSSEGIDKESIVHPKKINKLSDKLTDSEKMNNIESSAFEDVEKEGTSENSNLNNPEPGSYVYIKPLLGTFIEDFKHPAEFHSSFDEVISNATAKQKKYSLITTVTSNQTSPFPREAEHDKIIKSATGPQKGSMAESIVASNEHFPKSIELPQYQGKLMPSADLEVDLQKDNDSCIKKLVDKSHKQRESDFSSERGLRKSIESTEKQYFASRNKWDLNLKTPSESISLIEAEPKLASNLPQSIEPQNDNKQNLHVASKGFPLEVTIKSLEPNQRFVHDTTQAVELENNYQNLTSDVFEVTVTNSKRQCKDNAGINTKEAPLSETASVTKHQNQLAPRKKSRVGLEIVPVELAPQSLLESSQCTELPEVLTKRQRQRKQKISPPEISETMVSLTPNISRQSRKTSPLLNCDITSATIKSSAEKRGSIPRLKSTARKRIKLERGNILNQSDDEDFLGFPDKADLPVLIQDLINEIKIEQNFDDKRDVKIGQKKILKSDKNITCGNCKETVLTKQWTAHLRNHNGLGFREGLDPPLDLKDYRTCLNVMNYYMKMNKITQVACEKCGLTRKSALGLLQHIKICGLSEEEKRIPCIHCGKRLLEGSMQSHLQFSCAVLKRKEMEYIEKNESDPNLEKEKDDTVEVTESGRAKRKSVKAAEKKIKSFIELIDDADVDNHFSEKKPPKIYGGTKKSWACQLRNSGVIKCKIKNCDFKADSVQDMFLHATTCQNPDDVYGFYCRHCKYYSLVLEPMVKHISKEHGNILTNINEFENQSGSEASAGEESSESEGSSGEEEIECDPGSDIEENYEEMLDGGSKERSRVRLSVATSSGGGSGEYKTTESAEALLRDYSLVIKQPLAKSSFYHFAFKWTTQFVAKYFSCDPLYLNFRPTIASYINNTNANEYIPNPKTSPKFSVRVENSYQADWGILASKVNSEDWDCLELFHGRYNKHQNIILYCGGPILSLDWATFPVSYKDDQYLAVYSYQDYKDSTRFNELKGQKGLIQVWNLGNLSKNQAPVMKYAFKVDYGPVCDIKFCPSGGYIPTERIGLLAVTSLVGDVYIFSLPFNIDEKQFTNIIELQPSVTLRPCAKDTTRCRQGYRLSWTKDKEHSIIAAGYTDGWVAIWDLRTESKLLKKTINFQQIIIPTKLFHPFTGTICGIEIFHVNNSQWLMVAADKEVKMFDLKTYANPLEVSNVYQKSTITCSAWSIHWPGYLLGLNESFCLLRNSVTLTQPHEIGYKNYPIQSFDATVTDISFSDYLNAYTAATDSGDIIAYLPRDLLLNLSRKGNRRIKMISGFTDTVELDTDLGSDIPSKFGVVFCDLPEPVLSSLCDLKSKRHRRWPLEYYPIVTITRVKFNPNENVHKYYALGTQAGFVRIRYMMSRRDC